MPATMRGSPLPRPPPPTRHDRPELFSWNESPPQDSARSRSPNRYRSPSEYATPPKRDGPMRHGPAPSALRPSNVPNKPVNKDSLSAFVRISLPGDSLDKRRGIPIERGNGEDDKISWSMPPAAPGQVNVMLDTLETVAVPLHCLQPVSTLQDSSRKPAPWTEHGGFGSTFDGCRRDRSYTARHGGGLTSVSNSAADHIEAARHAANALKSTAFSLGGRRPSFNRRPSFGSSQD